MREKQIEQQLCHAAREQGGIAMKLASPSFAGLPDRMVLLPGGHIGFVEVKAPGKKPRVLQLMRLEFLSRLGFKVYVLDRPEKIPAVIRSIRDPRPQYHPERCGGSSSEQAPGSRKGECP